MVGKKSWRWKRAEYQSDSASNVQLIFSVTCAQMFLWQHSLISLPRRTNTLEDSGFPHGIELLDRIVLLVEVCVGLFPGLCYCVLLWKVRFIHGFRTSPPQSSFSSSGRGSDSFYVQHLPHWNGFRVTNDSVTLKAMAATSERPKAMGRWNLRRLASSPLITGLGRDMMAHNLGGGVQKRQIGQRCPTCQHTDPRIRGNLLLLTLLPTEFHPSTLLQDPSV